MAQPTARTAFHLEKGQRVRSLHATAHAVLRDHYAFWNFWLTIGALVPTASLLCLVFVSDDFASHAFHVSPDELRLVNATVALFAFICVLVQLVWKPDSRETSHAHAVNFYVGLERSGGEADAFFGLSGPQTMPPIREAMFIRLKRFHVRKLGMSRLLDENPWRELPRDGVTAWWWRLWPARAVAPTAPATQTTLCTCGDVVRPAQTPSASDR